MILLYLGQFLQFLIYLGQNIPTHQVLEHTFIVLVDVSLASYLFSLIVLNTKP